MLVFVYYGFYERTFFHYMYIFKVGKTIKKKKKKKKRSDSDASKPHPSLCL